MFLPFLIILILVKQTATVIVVKNNNLINNIHSIIYLQYSRRVSPCIVKTFFLLNFNKNAFEIKKKIIMIKKSHKTCMQNSNFVYPFFYCDTKIYLCCLC